MAAIGGTRLLNTGHVPGWVEMCLEYQVHTGFQRFRKKKRLQNSQWGFFNLYFERGRCLGPDAHTEARGYPVRVDCLLPPRGAQRSNRLSDAVVGPFTHWASHRPLFSKTSWQNVAIILWYSGLNKMYDRNYFHRFLAFPNGAIWKKNLIPLVICLTFNFFSIFIVLRWDLTQPRLIFCFWRGRGRDSVSLCRPGCPRNLAL